MEDLTDLRNEVNELRKNYLELTRSKILLDACEIHRALKSGEMHNWIACCNRMHCSSDEMAERWDRIKQDKKLYDSIIPANETYGRLQTLNKELGQKVILNGIEKGETYSSILLILSGFDSVFVKKHERNNGEKQ